MMDDSREAHLVGAAAAAKFNVYHSRIYAMVLGFIQVALLIIFAVVTKSSKWDENKPAGKNAQLYNYLSGVMLMMFVGFGYLMTFLRHYGLGAVGFTMLITCLGAQISLLAEPLFAADSWSHKVEIGLPELMNAMFCVAACLISFGGLIGKVGPMQLLILVCFEVVFYSANKILILTRWLDIVDCGGTIVIHMFGAYFGLAAALVLGVPSNKFINNIATASTQSDVLALIGTTVLWVYWPSFVVGGLPSDATAQQGLALVNTLLALLGSTVGTFVSSAGFSNGELQPADIQNAALAGGVSIGAVANLDITPVGAILIGCLAGAVSTAGYHYIKVQILQEKMGLHDSCGIHCLHGMPSLIGGLASVIIPHIISDSNAGGSGTQLAGIGLTLVTSIATGLFTGCIMKLLKDGNEMGEDHAYWEVAKARSN